MFSILGYNNFYKEFNIFLVMVLEEEVDELKETMKLLHPIPKNQDGNCPKIEWMGLGHGSGVGEWKCLLQTETYGDLSRGGGSENLDYLPCNNSDYNKCPIYLANHEE